MTSVVFESFKDGNIVPQKERSGDIPDGHHTNPLFISMKTENALKDMDLKSLSLFAIALSDDISKDSRANILMSKKYLTDEEIRELSKDIVFVKVPSIVFKIKGHHKYITVAKRSDLTKLSSEQFELDQPLLVLTIMKEHVLNKYLGLFGNSTFEDYRSLTELVKYFNTPRNLVASGIGKLIDFGYSYWADRKNCNLNINSEFLDRSFPKDKKEELENGYIRASDTVKTLVDRATKDPSNYNMPNVLTYKKYVDASNVNNESKTYKVPRYEYSDPEEIESQFANAITSRERFILFSEYATNKYKLHDVLHNTNIMKMLKDDFETYSLPYSYVFGYAWLTMYLEECVNGVFTTKDSRHMFTLVEACNLPVFPIAQEAPHSSPYFPLMIGEKLLNLKDNLVGLPVYSKEGVLTNGLTNLDTFKARFSSFLGDVGNSVFEKLDFKKLGLAVTGSSLIPCIQSNPPHMRNYFESNFEHMVTELYGDSDIDVMCNKKSIVEFLDVADKICKTISEKTNTSPKVEAKRQVSIIFTDELMDILFDDPVDALKNLSKHSYQFYSAYVAKKMSSVSKLKKQLGNENPLFSTCLYSFVDEDDMIVRVTNNLNYDPEYTSDDTFFLTINDMKRACEGDDLVSKEENKVVVKVVESVKLKISQPGKMDHPIELFRSKKKDFSANVVQFHQPPVRGFYDGTQVYLTSSMISAYMTNLCLDIKYVAGTTNPRDIVLKTFQRGFGTLLNKSELEDLKEYVSTTDKWSSYTGTITGFVPLTSSWFRPNTIKMPGIEDMYKPEDSSYTSFITESDIIDYYKRKGTDLENLTVNFSKVRTISKNGKVLPYKKSVAMLLFDDIATS